MPELHLLRSSSQQRPCVFRSVVHQQLRAVWGATVQNQLLSLQKLVLATFPMTTSHRQQPHLPPCLQKTSFDLVELSLVMGKLILFAHAYIHTRFNHYRSSPTPSVSVKRRHSVFDAQNFGQNAQKRKTVRQVTQRIFR